MIMIVPTFPIHIFVYLERGKHTFDCVSNVIIEPACTFTQTYS